MAAHLNLPLRGDPAIVEAMEKRFAARGWKDAREQPAAGTGAARLAVLANPHGTAPGLWIEHGDAVIRAGARAPARNEADD